MRASLAVLAVSLLHFACPSAWGLAADKPTREKRAQVYDSPEKAFVAYQDAVERKDADTAFEALTPECRDTLLFDHWAEEVTGESWQGTPLSKLVDYSIIEWVDIKTSDPQQREAVRQHLRAIHVPGVETETGFRVLGWIAAGQDVAYIT